MRVVQSTAILLRCTFVFCLSKTHQSLSLPSSLRLLLLRLANRVFSLFICLHSRWLAILSASRFSPPSPPSLLPSSPLFQQRARTSALVFSIRSSYMPPTTDCLPERMQATFHAASLLFHSFVSPARQRSSSDTKLARKFYFDNEIPISAYLTPHVVRFYGGCYLGRRGSQRMVFIMSERPSAPLAQFLMLT